MRRVFTTGSTPRRRRTEADRDAKPRLPRSDFRIAATRASRTEPINLTRRADGREQVRCARSRQDRAPVGYVFDSSPRTTSVNASRINARQAFDADSGLPLLIAS
jgi:hypothetical protein